MTRDTVLQANKQIAAIDGVNIPEILKGLLSMPSLAPFFLSACCIRFLLVAFAFCLLHSLLSRLTVDRSNRERA
jgi:hypothetical protein